MKIDPVSESVGAPASAREIAEGGRKVSAAASHAMKARLDDSGAILELLVKNHIHHRGQMTIIRRQAEVKTLGVETPPM